ncbi:helix-turn-helix domain-containing protein [Microbacterium aerolatum]|uniref:helix-turn-helix domain-containing protein n=1 Tax=Microbacterium aerolatum TaxID=153731 RepID=UPI00384BB4B0
MAENVTPISRAISDVLTGAYARKRLTQDQIAAKVDMSPVTLQKKLRGRSPITATDLVILARAIGVDPASVLNDAIEDVATAERQKSEGVASIADQRRKKTPAEMTDDELEAFEGESAANTDPEMGHDEPEAP